MKDTDVTPIRTPAPTCEIVLNIETAPLLLELVTKAAAPGPQAALLADLYAQALRAARILAGQ